jgi:hypothetical protein
MKWIISPALETLRWQLNEAFPRRSKASDGGIGDSSHQASPSSDHNPHVKNPTGGGVVTARDFTHDPKTGIDCQWLADTLVKNRDPRIKYIIWNKRICSSKQQPWVWRKYSGSNAHSKHLHLSVMADRWMENRPWDLDFPDDENADEVARVEDPPTEEQEPAAGEIPSTPAAGDGGPSGEAPAVIKPDPVPAQAAAGTVIATEGSSPASLVAKVEEVIEVEQLKPEHVTGTLPQEEDKLTKIGNKVVGFWGVVGTTALAIGTFLTSTPIGIAISIVSVAGVIVLGYLVVNALRQNAKDKRDEATRAREAEAAEKERQRVHELQVLTLRSAMGKDLNTVRLVPAPPATEVPSGQEQ